MKKLQRLRANPILRDMLSEVEFLQSQLIQPLFVVEGLAKDEPVAGLKGVARQSASTVLHTIEADLEAGVRQFILFHIPARKQARGLEFAAAAETISGIKTRFGAHLQLWVDTCLCSSTTHGHCGLFGANGGLDSEATLAALSDAALAFARAGADGVAPSDMMDGRTAALRARLDREGHTEVPILSYSTKFASHFYGPFRNAADSAPTFGDRKQYQIDVRNRSDALLASQRCADEGADLLMVKPGMLSLDLITPIRTQTGLPVGAYQVSGEFAGLCLMAEQGLISYEKALLETWYVFKRAGAQFVVTYGARDFRNVMGAL